MENNNGIQEKKSEEDFNLYANPYADEDFKNNEVNNPNNNNKNNDEINKNNNLNDNASKNIKIKKNNNSNKKINEDIIENNNDNKMENNINNKNNIKKSPTTINKSKTQDIKKKIYTIKETGSHLYIENTKKIALMAIEKNFNKIYTVKDFTEMLNVNPMKSYQVDSILGIIDLNGNNKYLLVVSLSQIIANILGANIFNILDVDLIKITLFNENDNEKNRMVGVKKLFQTKNFYYSNDIDLSNNNIFSKNKKNRITDYCVNSSLLQYFFDNLISNDFYTKIIYGYVGSKKNIEITNNKNNNILMDILIIERVNKHLTFNTDIPNQMKEIEFISIYKNYNYNNKSNRNIFSFIFYISNEISNIKIAFNPWNNFIINELSNYSNLVCI